MKCGDFNPNSKIEVNGFDKSKIGEAHILDLIVFNPCNCQNERYSQRLILSIYLIV